MPFIHKIANINEHIKNIEYKNQKENYEITITTCKKNKFIFCMGNEQLCCEEFGWYFSTSPITDTKNKLVKEQKYKNNKLPKDIKQYINKQIININIYERNDNENNSTKDYVGDEMVMEINLEGNNKINFVMYNYHNGYYTHSVWLDVAENGDTKTMRVVKTVI